ncbi:MAG: 2Fe-2S iron-sulfur cluster-binding protein [Colwellia sp.]|nr:2Fe-2S iron-sulfur cluster-binding protein [Colwellia sp.]
MTQIIFKLANGDIKVVQAQNGVNLMLAAVENNISGIKAICNGGCNCATCHVMIEPKFFEKLPSKSPDEQQLLAKIRTKQPTSRLACQIMVTSQMTGMKVIVK